MPADRPATHTTNGVDVERLVATINAVQENPDLARFRFQAQTEWIQGARSRTRFQSFHQASQEVDDRKRPLVMEGDEPGVLLGTDTAPNAVESVLHALTSCLTVGFAYNAAARGIAVENLEFSIDGDLDLRPFLGISQEGRPGYEGLQISCRVKSDAPREQIEELCRYVQETSPVMDIVRNPVPVNVTLET
jgi:uncharacterized OsmC-like protein